MQWTNVPWSTGTIKAVGMKGGVQAAVDSIATAGAAAKVTLKTNNTTLYADGEDVCCIEADIADANNTLIFKDSSTVSFSFTGAGRSLGIASGNWTSAEPFKATSRKAYHGKALIVIQSTMDTGTINVTVSSTGLTSANLTIKTVPQSISTAIQRAFLVKPLETRAGLFTCIQNPGSKNVRVRYGVDVPGAVSLSVISPSGRTISCLTNKYHKAGTYSMDWNPVNKSGVYFFVLKTNDNRMVRKEFLVQ
jgi:hypothetical protein